LADDVGSARQSSVSAVLSAQQMGGLGFLGGSAAAIKAVAGAIRANGALEQIKAAAKSSS
jgi:hypothetical protein